MTQYAGTPTFPKDFTIPDDSSLPAALTFNVAYEALGDRTVYVRNALAAIPALSWNPGNVTAGQPVRRACFNEREAAWYAVFDGAADKMVRSTDFGQSWALVGGLASAFACVDVAADPAGNMVVGTTSQNIYDYNGAVFTPRAAVFAGVPSGVTVNYAQGPNLWCATYRNGVLGIRAFTSINRALWTDRTLALPPPFTAYVGTQNHQAGVGSSGDIVALLNTGTGVDYKGAHSNDGGVTWTGFFLPTLVNAKFSRPAYSPTENLWMVSAYDDGGFKKTEIWTSQTGFGGWVLSYSNLSGTIAFVQLANVGFLWVALGADGRIYYSLDQGASWRFAQVRPVQSADIWLFAASGGLLAIDTTAIRAVPSVRIGPAGLGV